MYPLLGQGVRSRLNGDTALGAAIRTEGLTRRFGSLTALDGLTIDVAPGEIFGLLGANGAGKSTAIKILTTLLRPTSGRAEVAGFDVVEQSREVRRRIGYVPQMVCVDGALTGYENLIVAARLHALPRAEREQRIDEALAFVGLRDCAAVLAREYSGGMCRRLELAQGLLHRPTVLFLDEPTLGLDPVARWAVWSHIRELPALGTSVLLTTHYMDEAEDLCDTVAILRHGHLVAMGTPEELKREVGVNASLDDVFARYCGSEDAQPQGGGLHEVRRTRRAARHHS